jgi:hypothetical protein
MSPLNGAEGAGLATREYVSKIAKSSTKQLNPLDQLRVVERRVTDLGAKMGAEEKKPLVSLHGALAHLGPAPSADDIDEVRRETWQNFPAGRRVMVAAIADTHRVIWLPDVGLLQVRDQSLTVPQGTDRFEE